MTEHDATLSRMLALAQQWEASSDRRAIFLNCYILMTSNMLEAIQRGEFHDGVWVDALLRHFAGYYFNALEAYEQRRDATPEVWTIAFDAANTHGTMTLQNLFLGINAHINYDLVFALSDLLESEWADLPDSRRAQRHADHCHVNAVIARTVDAVQDQVVDKFTPAMEIVDKMLGPVDEWVASQMIAHWRDEVWAAALKLLETPEPNARRELHAQIEAETLRFAHTVMMV